MLIDPQPLAASNPRVRALRKLIRSRSARHDERRFVVDGPRALSTAVDSSAIESVFVDSVDRLTPELSAVLARAAARQSFDVYLLDAGVFDSVADSKTPQGVMAVAVMERTALDEVVHHSRVAVLDGVQDPGNVGAVVRVAAAFDVGAVVVCRGSGDPWSPKAVRGAAGTVGLLDLVVDCAVGDAIDALSDMGFITMVADMDGTSSMDDLAASDRLAVVLGSEGNGASPAVWNRVDGAVSIDMNPEVESLNVAVTAGIILHGVRPVAG